MRISINGKTHIVHTNGQTDAQILAQIERIKQQDDKAQPKPPVAKAG